MGTRVVWSPAALDDVDEIAAFIAKDSAFYASAVVSKILATSKALSDFALLGRIVPELGDTNIRERVVYSYRLIYRVTEAEATVLAVVHGKRLLESASGRFKTD